MNLLADTLERFNRKERNLLIRDILDCCETPPPLGPVFCERLAEVVDVPKPSLEDAWWATDFHFDWLAGALLIFMKGQTLDAPPNTSMPANAKSEGKVRLVMGNQEDIDLVVVAHDPAAGTYHLILFEAKAYGGFNEKQYKRKMNRLELLYAFYTGLRRVSTQANDSPHNIVFHYVAYSPNEPKRLEPVRLPWQSNVATKPKHTYLRLRLSGSSILTVKRCDAKDQPSIEGAWKCELLRSSRRSGTPQESR